MPLDVIVLAAGQGKRMRSALPKVLHSLGGRPLLAYVLDTARVLGARNTVVVHGHGADAVRSAFGSTDVHWVLQGEQLGTGHAVQQALPLIGSDAQVLILYGDVPLVRLATLKRLLEAAGDGLAITTAELAEPRGYGRIVRDRAGRVERIVEEKDASAVERGIREINAGLMALPGRRLGGWLGAIGNRNAQKEYYLTDVVTLALRDGVAVNAVKVEDAM
ncbi:MAG TPA: NTP transferase domain-containing protein, partial [Burkholderiales bacterium]|nr:NTP transferase domain-containing protein [Burkholderiales bacterium]